MEGARKPVSMAQAQDTIDASIGLEPGSEGRIDPLILLPLLLQNEQPMAQRKRLGQPEACYCSHRRVELR